MSGTKRKADELDDCPEEEAAEKELSKAIKAANESPEDEEISGLGSGKAPIYFNVPGTGARPPWEMYTARPDAGEKPLVFAYFAIRGLGEVPRMLLAEAGAAYQHIAITGGESQENSLNWRERSPNGLLPMMSGLGVPRKQPLCDSGAIIRFLAHKYGMSGADELEAARIDTLFGCAKDLLDNKASIVNGDADPNQAKQPIKLGKRIEDMISHMNPPEKDDAVFNYGQIYLLYVLLACDEANPGCVKQLSPNLDRWRQEGKKRPRIAAYLNSPMRFPLTCKEKGDTEGGYKFAPVKRADFAK